ncbi:MAG: NrsF family protein [Proteobacteria bacterium]|nr:NrsF family protein [Pseudomonadota bacterium]
MNTDDLITQLSNESEPVNPVDSPLKNLIKWSLVSLFCLSGAFALFGIRDDYYSAMLKPEVIIQVIFMVVLAISSALSAFLLSIPDVHKTATKVTPLLTLAGWGLYLFIKILMGDGGEIGSGFSCIRDIAFLGLPIAAMILFIVRVQAKFNLFLTSIFAGLSAAALGAISAQFICHNDAILHLFFWHYLPVVGISLLAVFIGKKLQNQ